MRLYKARGQDEEGIWILKASSFNGHVTDRFDTKHRRAVSRRCFGVYAGGAIKKAGNVVADRPSISLAWQFEHEPKITRRNDARVDLRLQGTGR